MKDEILFAFIDGELDPDQMERIAMLVATDPALSRRVERQQLLLREARADYDGDLAQPLPDDWIAMIDRHFLAGQADNVVSLAGARARRPGMFSRAGAAAALAASLVIGLGLGSTLRAPQPGLVADRGGSFVATAGLARALADGRSGVPVPLDGARTVTIKLSLKAADGSYCREALLSGGTDQHILACSDRTGWRIRALVGGEADSAGGYRQAAGDDPLDPLIDRAGGDVLDAAAETAAIKAGWR